MLFGGGRWVIALLASIGLYLAAVCCFVRGEFFAIAVTLLGLILLIVPLLQDVTLGLLISRSEKDCGRESSDGMTNRQPI